MSAQRILVLGGGYTGVVVAGQLARRLRPQDASVTLVTDSAVRHERMRWHQLASGQQFPTLSIEEALKGSRVGLRIAGIHAIDLQRHAVRLTDGDEVGYDSLVITLGSVIDFGTVAGARENAHGLTAVDAITAAARQVAARRAGAPVTVVGGGLTGIELATEVAQSHPRLRVSIVSSRPAGHWLSDRARRYLRRVFDRFGVEQVVGRVERIDPDRVVLAQGREVPSSVTCWAGGFRANPLVAASGLEVDELGRAQVDATFRAVSHPDVWVVGDAARGPGRDGQPLKMGCRTGALMALAVPAMIAADLAGTEAAPFRGRYFAECISLGRHDALLQWLTPEGQATDHVVTGRPALLLKEYVHWGTGVVARHPGPYLPVRRVRTGGAADARREKIGA